MKKCSRILISQLLILGMFLLLTTSCKRSDGNLGSSLEGTMTDIDGNTYKTIQIGRQVWMAENLKTTRYRNGDPIPNVTADLQWTALSTGAYCWFNNDAASNRAIHGAIYNWYTIADSRNIAPTGWHVPTDDEWTVLIAFLGGESVAGGKMKVPGITYWNSPNTGANNSSGFTSLASGFRARSGSFSYFGTHIYFWSTSEMTSDLAWTRDLGYNSADVIRYTYDKGDGFYVRCVKN